MECEAHAGKPVRDTCSVCGKPRCETCLAFEVDGQVACSACADVADERGRVLGSTLLAFVGLGYLAVLAIAYKAFRAQPFVGGIAAVAALAIGRLLQALLKLPHVVRRAG